jgi:hypothetical protein
MDEDAHSTRGGLRAALEGRLPLAVVFGVASIPWTYGFVAGLEIPLWPSFVASATYYAAGEGTRAFLEGYANNLAGICYGAATLAVVDGYLGGGPTALAVVVGLFMFLASVHGAVPLLSFTPGGFLGYATMFSVHAAGATALGVPGLAGETLATVLSMFVGAAIGIGTDELASSLAS